MYKNITDYITKMSNTTRKNRKKKDQDQEENIKEIEIQENDTWMSPILEKNLDLIQYAREMERTITDLKPPYIWECLHHYTCIEIDGIPVTIYVGKEKNKNTYRFQIIAESSGIKSEDTDRYDRDITLHSGNGFNNVLSILKHIEKVKTSYKLIEHELMSLDKIQFVKIQRRIYPLSPDKNCSVCYEPTIEYTLCKHPICFRCRYTCVMSNNLVCPICRNGELKVFPTELALEVE
jgi:hypothetical protein